LKSRILWKNVISGSFGGGKLEGPKVEVREIDFLITVYDPVAKEKTFEVLYIFEEKLKATEMK